MAHTFRALNKYFLADTESGSLFEVDYLTHRLVKAQADDFGSQFKADEIAEAQAELARLRAEGLLDAPAGPPPRFSDEGVVKALCLNVSHACNLACGYCFAGDGSYGQTVSGSEKGNNIKAASGQPALMSAETAANAVDFLISRSGKRRNLEIDFFGGEPLLNLGVVQKTVDYAKKRAAEAGKAFKFTITTNGVLLCGETADYINREFYNAVVSMDGRREVHTSMRRAKAGGDNFDLILDNALRFTRARGGKSWYIRGTFTNRNLDFAADVEFLANAGFSHISLEPVVLPDNHPLAIREEHVPRILEEYDRLAELYLLREREGRPFEFFHFNIDLEGAPCREKLTAGCGAGSQYMAVSPSGGIYPCHRFDGVRGRCLGNVNQMTNDEGQMTNDNHPVRSASARPEEGDTPTLTPHAALYTSHSGNKLSIPFVFIECENCWAKYYCGGGCRANAEFLCGGTRPYGVGCELLKKRTELALALHANALTIYD